jgi:hypothetical protein
MAILFKLKLLESCSMGQLLQRYRDYGCGLVVLINRKLVDQLMFNLEHIWQLMAIVFILKLLEFCLMDQLQQHYHGYECGLVVLLNRKLVDRLRFILVRIWQLMARSF